MAILWRSRSIQISVEGKALRIKIVGDEVAE